MKTRAPKRDPRIPVVRARRDRSLPGNDLLVITCPYCGKTHTHGACGKGSPRGAGDGHREAHCVRPTETSERGYYIVEES